MYQNTSADPSCQWSQQLFIDETYGASASVTSINEGAVSLATQIPAIFGTTRLQAWNSLNGTLCWSGVTPGSSSTVFVGMSNGLSQTLQVNFAGPPPAPVQIAATPTTISMTAADRGTPGSATLNVTLSDKTQTWTASVFPATRASSWLSATPLSGTGNATIKLQANGTAFEPGVYRALIVIQSPTALPESITVPVMFVLGSGSITGDTGISGVVNSASLAANISPGSLALINGSNLANSAATAPTNISPRPFTLGGVTVQVNGLNAPILSISPAQLRIQIPYEAGAGPAVIGVNNNGQIAGFQAMISPVAPAIFVPAAGLKANLGGNVQFTLTGDGDITPSLNTGFAPSGTTTVPSVYKARLPLSVSIAGHPLFITSYGLQPGAVGTTLINATLPGWIPTGPQPLVVTVNGVDSAPVTITVNAQ